PPFGFSTLAMSAPIQASASVQVVPASNCVRSSTRIPARQPGEAGVTSIVGSLSGEEVVMREGGAIGSVSPPLQTSRPPSCRRSRGKAAAKKRHRPLATFGKNRNGVEQRQKLR